MYRPVTKFTPFFQGMLIGATIGSLTLSPAQTQNLSISNLTGTVSISPDNLVQGQSVTGQIGEVATYHWVDIVRPVTKKTPIFIRTPRADAYIPPTVSPINLSKGQSISSPDLSHVYQPEISNPTISQTFNVPDVIELGTVILSPANLSHAQPLTSTLSNLIGFLLRILVPCDEITPYFGGVIIRGPGIPEGVLSIWPIGIPQGLSPPDLTGVHELPCNEPAISQSVSQPSLGQIFFSTQSDLRISQFATVPSLIQTETSLSPSKLSQSQSVSSPTTTVGLNNLSPDGISQAQGTDSSIVNHVHCLNPNAIDISQPENWPTLAQGENPSPDYPMISQAMDSPTFSHIYSLSVNSLNIGQSLSPGVLSAHLLNPNNLSESQRPSTPLIAKSNVSRLDFLTKSITYRFYSKSFDYNFRTKNINYAFITRPEFGIIESETIEPTTKILTEDDNSLILEDGGGYLLQEP